MCVCACICMYVSRDLLEGRHGCRGDEFFCTCCHGNLAQEEKLELAKLLDRVPIPVKEGVEEPSAKVGGGEGRHLSNTAGCLVKYMYIMVFCQYFVRGA